MNQERAVEAGSVGERALTFDRGLRVLKLLVGSDDELTVAQIATALGLHRQAIYRLVGTLEDHGLAVRSESGAYRVGAAVLGFGGSWVERLEATARPVLDDLAQCCGATCFLAVPEGEELVALVVAEPLDRDFHLAYRAGSRAPLGLGAAGIALLAGMGGDGPVGPEVRRARERGVAVTEGQVNAGSVGVAIYVPLRIGPLAHASICVVSLDEQIDLAEITAQLQIARDAVVSSLK